MTRNVADTLTRCGRDAGCTGDCAACIAQASIGVTTPATITISTSSSNITNTTNSANSANTTNTNTTITTTYCNRRRHHAPLTGEFITVSPEIAAASTCPELLHACLIYVDDYGGKTLSDSAKATLEPLRAFASSNGRHVCAMPYMDVWAAAVIVFELMRFPGGEGGVALFGSKMQVPRTTALLQQRPHSHY